MRRSNLIVLAVCVVVSCSLALGQAQKGKKGGSAGDAAKGQEVFQQCSVCHNADSTEKKMGPGLKGLFQNEKLANGKKPTEANVRTQIDEGGNGMPSYKEMLSDEEKTNLIAYLKTL
jgi:cytochrome c